jgi:phosphoribosylamine--glycine ligase
MHSVKVSLYIKCRDCRGIDMKILIVGGGGREHTLAWKISQSREVSKIYVAPGNGGIRDPMEAVPIRANDIDSLLDFVKETDIGFTIVGPEEPLTMGIVDRFEKEGLKVFGPSAAAAEIEGSKVFTREFLDRQGVPQPEYRIFRDPEEASKYIRRSAEMFPTVIKADGLAGGKGVIIAVDRNEALDAVKKIMIDKVFGDAGNRLLIERFLTGKEVSFFVITDGETIIPLATAQDYKRAYDSDRGPNTGGMGCYSPSAFVTGEHSKFISDQIIMPTLKGLADEGRPYRGFLYGGLMITEEGIKVLEFNCRMGDPEAQAIIPRIDCDLIPYMLAAAEGKLSEIKPLKWKDESAVTVILASEGYPASPKKGFKISGIEDAEAIDNVVLFHAGTAVKDGELINSGGRVIAVTALDKDIPAARERAYSAVSEISFEGMHYRKDIAADVE